METVQLYDREGPLGYKRPNCMLLFVFLRGGLFYSLPLCDCGQKWECACVAQTKQVRNDSGGSEGEGHWLNSSIILQKAKNLWVLRTPQNNKEEGARRRPRGNKMKRLTCRQVVQSKLKGKPGLP